MSNCGSNTGSICHIHGGVVGGGIVGGHLGSPTPKHIGQGLTRLMLDVDEITKLNWMAKTLNKTQDETIEMIVRAHLMGITIKDD